MAQRCPRHRPMIRMCSMKHAENDILSLDRLAAGKYGFTNRVIDGISLTITNLTFQIKAHGFKASIFVSGPSRTVCAVNREISLAFVATKSRHLQHYARWETSEYVNVHPSSQQQQRSHSSLQSKERFVFRSQHSSTELLQSRKSAGQMLESRRRRTMLIRLGQPSVSLSIHAAFE